MSYITSYVRNKLISPVVQVQVKPTPISSHSPEVIEEGSWHETTCKLCIYIYRI